MRYALENNRQLVLSANAGTTSLKPVAGRGPKGEDGSNVLPTDEAVENALAARDLPTSGSDLAASNAEAILDPESLPGEALREVGDARYELPLGIYMAILGDSITDQCSQNGGGVEGSPTNQTNARGYFPWADAFLQGRLDWCKRSDARWEFGASGLTVAQIVSGGHVTALLAASPHWALDASGTNSIQAGDTGASVFDQRRLGIWEPILAKGIRLVISTLLPRNSLSSGAKQELRAHNDLVRRYARTNRNIVLCDWHAAMVDQNTGDALSGATSDGTHPSGIGARLMGEVLADALRPFVPAAQRMLDPFDTRNMLRGSKAYMVGSSGGLATSWSVTAVGSGVTYTPTKVASPDLMGGEVQRLAVVDASYNGLSLQCNTGATGVADGLFTPDLDYVYGLIELETVAGTWDVKNFQANITYTGSTASTIALAMASAERTALAGSIRRPEGRLVLVTPTRRVPAGVTQVKLQLSIYGTGTFDVYRAAAVRVTEADLIAYGHRAFGFPPDWPVLA